MYYFADIFSGSIQSGKRTNLCDMLGSIKEVSVQEMMPVIKQWADGQGLNYNGYDRKVLQDTTYDINKNARQWTWQVCTEFGWFQVPNKDHPLRSKLIGPDYWGPFC